MLRQLMVCFLFFSLAIPQAYSTIVEPRVLELKGNQEIMPPEVNLSRDDLLWLAKTNKIVVAVFPPERPPLVLSNLTGRYQGINADYLLLLQKALHTDIVIKLYSSQQQALAALQQRQADLVLTQLTSQQEIGSLFITSDSMVHTFPTMVTRRDKVMQQLHTDKPVSIAVTEDFPVQEFIKQSFPNARISELSNDYQALISVVDGENDYFVGGNLFVNIMMRDLSNSLSIVKQWSEPKVSNRFIARKNEPQLIDTINKFIKNLNNGIQSQIVQTWTDGIDVTFMDKPLQLTLREKRWLQKNKKIRVLINPYYAPFIIMGPNAEIRGVVGDIFNLIHLKTGLEFEAVVAHSNVDMINIMQKGNWDLLPIASYSIDREDLASFTHPFITTPFVAVVKNTPEAISSLSAGMKVAIPEYHALLNILKEEYPDIEWVPVENTSVGLHMIEQDVVDASIYNLISAQYMIEHYYPGDLKYFIIADRHPASISFAMPKSDIELQGILNKVLDEIPQKEIFRLIEQWTKMPEVQIETWNLYSKQFYVVVVLSVLLVLSSLLWGVYLLRETRRRKKNQSDLEVQLSFLKTLSQSVPMPVYVISLDDTLKSYNSAFSNFFSPEKRKDIALSLFDKRHPLFDVFPHISGAIKKGVSQDSVVTHHLTLNNGHENRDILHWLTLCIMPANISHTIVCGWQDITESKRLMETIQVEKEKAVAATQAKSHFLASMSHEIRTPISTIMGFLELLSAHGQLSDEDMESVQLASDTAQHLLGLIGDILDIEKIELGEFALSPEWVDIESLILSILKTFEAQIKQKKLQLHFINNLDKDKYLWIDAKALRQVLSNLLSNAIKFTQQGSINVRAEMHAKGATQAQLIIMIADTGPGISQEDQQRLFKPFSQTESGKQQSGSGLGLVICRELVLQMNGEIKMSSQLGQGTTLTVALELPISRDIALVTPSPVLVSGDIPPSNISILIVDDHPNNRLLLRRQLNKLGYHPDEAVDGVQALERVKEHTYDLVITDVNMPNMDGITLTSYIRKFDKEMAIWGLTANAQAQEKEHCLAMGMNLCLFKPISLEKLDSSLRLLGSKTEKPTTSLGDVIDLDLLKNMMMDDTELLHQMLAASRQENTKDLTLAKEAAQIGDWQKLRFYLHRIHGSAQIMCAPALLEICEHLEKYQPSQIADPIIEEGLAHLEKQLKVINDGITFMINKTR